MSPETIEMTIEGTKINVLTFRKHLKTAMGESMMAESVIEMIVATTKIMTDSMNKTKLI